MKSVYLLLYILFPALISQAQEAPARENTQYEYVLAAWDEQGFLTKPRLRIYYGNGQIEEFGVENGASSINAFVQNTDRIVTAVNYLAGKGYELYKVIENDHDRDDTIINKYLFRRKK